MRTEQVITTIRDGVRTDLLREAELRFPKGVPDLEIRRAELLSVLSVTLATLRVDLPDPSREWTGRDFQRLEDTLLQILDEQGSAIAQQDVPDFLFGSQLLDLVERKVKASVNHLKSEFAIG